MSQKALVIITGASAGIGKGLAIKFSAEGHPLLLISRRTAPIEALNLPNTIVAGVDITDYNALKAAIDDAEKRFGPADLIINNAGVMLLGALADQEPSTYQKMIDTNITGLLHGCQIVLKGMIERKHGTIINVSSIAGRKAFPNHVVYCGTKYAVHGLTEALREEVSQKNVRVILIAPGVVGDTELLAQNDTQTVTNYRSWSDTFKVLEVKDVVDCTWFAYSLPQHACVRELLLGPTAQAS
eukprot:TRINITY_DN1678_c0_g1_i2.p1 TRINITY_DN1678_c0_g1~~TRINITY_DN1678_c0_g1_i2.p1  ORF type:complete len:272 (-),score=65.08 TRINITY_DN1678_c0_g1_i2:166-888(-)